MFFMSVANVLISFPVTVPGEVTCNFYENSPTLSCSYFCCFLPQCHGYSCMKRYIFILVVFGSLITFASKSLALPNCPDRNNVYRNNCFGTYIYTNGDKYIGEFRDNRSNGQGTYYSLSDTVWKGDIYVGWFKNGKFHGQGTYTYADGRVETGKWEAGKLIYTKKSKLKPTYAIGHTGPAGGIVFYVTDRGTHGLEAAPADLSDGSEWGCSGGGTPIAGADGTAVGTGAQNTADILAGCSQPGTAAALADSYRLKVNVLGTTHGSVFELC
jgi:hypothetical protein